jgi:hypothetical protein
MEGALADAAGQAAEKYLLELWQSVGEFDNMCTLVRAKAQP